MAGSRGYLQFPSSSEQRKSHDSAIRTLCPPTCGVVLAPPAASCHVLGLAFGVNCCGNEFTSACLIIENANQERRLMRGFPENSSPKGDSPREPL